MQMSWDIAWGHAFFFFPKKFVILTKTADAYFIKTCPDIVLGHQFNLNSRSKLYRTLRMDNNVTAYFMLDMPKTYALLSVQGENTHAHLQKRDSWNARTHVETRYVTSVQIAKSHTLYLLPTIKYHQYIPCMFLDVRPHKINSLSQSPHPHYQNIQISFLFFFFLPF